MVPGDGDGTDADCSVPVPVPVPVRVRVFVPGDGLVRSGSSETVCRPSARFSASATATRAVSANAARVSASSAVDGPRPSDQSFSFPRSHPDESAPWVPTRVPTAPAASSSARIHASRVRQPPPTHANDARLPGGATTSNSHPPSFHRGARTTTRASARECAAKMTRFRARPPVVRTGARTKGPSEGAEGAKGASEGASGSGASRLCSSSTLDIAEASARRMSFPGTTAAEQEIQRPAAREVAPEGKRPRRHVSVPERRTRGSRPGRDERGASFGSRRPAERRSRTARIARSSAELCRR